MIDFKIPIYSMVSKIKDAQHTSCRHFLEACAIKSSNQDLIIENNPWIVEEGNWHQEQPLRSDQMVFIQLMQIACILQ